MSGARIGHFLRSACRLFSACLSTSDHQLLRRWRSRPRADLLSSPSLPPPRPGLSFFLLRPCLPLPLSLTAVELPLAVFVTADDWAAVADVDWAAMSLTISSAVTTLCFNLGSSLR